MESPVEPGCKPPGQHWEEPVAAQPDLGRHFPSKVISPQVHKTHSVTLTLQWEDGMG